MIDKLRLSRIRIFLNEVVAELKKVSWPSKNEVYRNTLVVVLLVFTLAVYLNAIDVIVGLLKKEILKLLR